MCISHHGSSRPRVPTQRHAGPQSPAEGPVHMHAASPCSGQRMHTGTWASHRAHSWVAMLLQILLMTAALHLHRRRSWRRFSSAAPTPLRILALRRRPPRRLRGLMRMMRRRLMRRRPTGPWRCGKTAAATPALGEQRCDGSCIRMLGTRTLETNWRWHDHGEGVRVPSPG